MIVKYLTGYTDPFLSPVTGQLSSSDVLPDLELGYVWMGNKNSRPTPTFKIIDLNIDVRALQDQVRTIEMAPVVVNRTQEAFPNAQALDQLDDGLMKNVSGMIEIAQPDIDYLTPSLQWGKIWIGDFSNNAAPQLTISNYNLPNLTYNKIWVGSSTNRPVEADLTFATNSASYILKTSNPNLTNAQALDMLLGTPPKILKAANDGTIEVAIPDQDYATNATLEEIKAQTEQYAQDAATSAEEAAASAEEATASAEEATASAEEATASAAESAASAAESAASAAEATASAAEATASAAEATAAAAEATAAAVEATAAAVEASASAAEATAAAAEASVAAIGASASAFQAIVASLSANIAEGNAQNSANDARDSASEASIFASNASNSANSAAFSASSASNSATSAQNSLDTFLNTGIVLQGAVYGAGSPSVPITTSFQANAVFPGNASVTIPVGTTTQRPSVLFAGMIRYNTDSA